MKNLIKKMRDFFGANKKKQQKGKEKIKWSSKEKIDFLEQFSNLLNS